MKNLFARGGIEFLAVLLGISGSLWMENNRQVKFKWVNGLNIYVGKGDSCLGGNVFFGLIVIMLVILIFLK